MAEGLSSEELIRLRAHAIWVAEGEPKGREKEHWERARREKKARHKEARREGKAEAEG